MAYSHQQVVFADKTRARPRGSYEARRVIELHFASHGQSLQSSIRVLGCRGGNHENAAGRKVTVWLLDGHGVGDAARLYCHAASLNFSDRNTSRHGNCPGAVLIAHYESRAAALLQNAIG